MEDKCTHFYHIITTYKKQTLKNKVMKIIIEDQTLMNFEAWSGAKETKEIIINEGKDEDFCRLIEELYPEGITDTQLNDILWFEEDWIFANLDINQEEDEEE